MSKRPNDEFSNETAAANNEFEIEPTPAETHGAHAGETFAYKRRVEKKKKHKVPLAVRILLIVLAAIVAIAVGVAIALNVNNARMQSMIQDINVTSNITAGDETSPSGQRITYQGHTFELNQNIVSCLVIGHDDSGETEGNSSQADMVAVFAIDTSTGKITMIGIPRDSMVTVDRYGVNADGTRGGYAGQETEQLCLAYSYGEGQDAVDDVEAAVERLLYNVPITYTFDINEHGIIDLNDAIGGVTLTSLEDIPTMSLSEGEEITLEGKDAYEYVTYRTHDGEGSLLRQARQSQYIREYLSQVLSAAKDDIGVVSDLYGVASDNVLTNLDPGAAVYLAQCAVAHGISVDTVTLKGSLSTDDAYAEYNLDQSYTRQTVINTYYKQVD